MPSPRYFSTRDPAHEVTFREALLSGLAPDGGLYVPTFIPHVPEEAWHKASSIADLGARVLPYWLGGEIPESDLPAILADALSFDAPLVPLEGDTWNGVSILELFHGPTLSFKDFGARTMARLMSYFLRDQEEPLTILVATSGDTGSAVADGFAGQEKIRVVLLFPKGQVSPVQERQLIVKRPGVQALAVQGTFDDCQRMVKQAFVDPDLASLPLSSANSINVARLLPQMLYYFWGYVQAGHERVRFCVPSGNLGNLTGGMLSALSGLPVERFIAAHNANDFFPRHLAEGWMDFQPSRRTRSNAMDVGVPSNFERLRALVSEDDLRTWIWGTSVSDAETLDAMRRVYEETGYIADPHTAVGLEAASRYESAVGRDAATIVLSTAHPAKFPEAVHKALGIPPPTSEQLEKLRQHGTAVAEVPPTVEALKEYLLTYARP
ncbi:MAG TPA: threonine synthase [Rhodothermales bacterium]|nr:threonine synthase [Rhodothermales bacterium]